jgi:hypothetical protein
MARLVARNYPWDTSAMEVQRGQAVVVRTFGDVPCLRRFWSLDGRIALVVEDEWYEALSRGDLTHAVGVPVADVFHYDPSRRLDFVVGRPFGDWASLQRVSP